MLHNVFARLFEQVGEQGGGVEQVGGLDPALPREPGSTEKRPLGIPTVRDRVVQSALRSVIEPIFEREFAPQSYGFRPGRGCKDALRRVDELLQSGHVHVVDIDIKGLASLRCGLRPACGGLSPLRYGSSTRSRMTGS